MVSIIIVNYNTYNLVINCITSIYKFTDNLDFEIIVVDNFSTERDIENLIKIFPNVNLIMNPLNNGFGAGNNLGAKVAKGEFLFFLNSDTILLNNAIKELREFYKSNKSVGVCGANLYNYALEPTISYEQFFPGILRSLNFLFGGLLSKLYFKNNYFFNYTAKPMIIQGYVSGASFFISKKIFDDVGGFDEDFFMYYEETELTFRIINTGKKSYSVPAARIIHLEGGSQKKISNIKKEWMYNSRELYFYKTKTPNYLLVKFIDNITQLRVKIKSQIINYKKL